MFLLVFFPSFLATSNGVVVSRLLQLSSAESSKYLTQDELWLNQTLDHFSPYVINRLFLSLCIFPCVFLMFFTCTQSCASKLVNDFTAFGINYVSFDLLWLIWWIMHSFIHFEDCVIKAVAFIFQIYMLAEIFVWRLKNNLETLFDRNMTHFYYKMLI